MFNHKKLRLIFFFFLHFQMEGYFCVQLWVWEKNQYYKKNKIEIVIVMFKYIW
jgi:hypothetical protein